MKLTSELDTDTGNQIDALCSAGDQLVEDGDLEGAIKKFEAALGLLPEPIEIWEASTWILTALGETCFFCGQHSSARMHLERVLHCPDALENPLIHLRLGQVLLELGASEKAADELARAYMLGDHEIFGEEDPKYYEFVSARLSGLPPV